MIDVTNFTLRNDLTAIHFSHGLFNFSKTTFSRHPVENFQFILSSIIHFHFAIDAGINIVSDDIIYTEKSPFFIKEDERTPQEKKLFSRWQNLSIVEKFSFITTKYNISVIPENFNEEVKELNKLRNFIVHNKIYHSTYTSEPNPDGKGNKVLDITHDIDSKGLFPNTKFNLPRDLTPMDCFTALKICLNMLLILSQNFHLVVMVHLPTGDARTFCIIDKTKSFNENLQEILAKLSSIK